MILNEAAILTGFETGPGYLLGTTSSCISPGSFGLFLVAEEKVIERGRGLFAVWSNICPRFQPILK